MSVKEGDVVILKSEKDDSFPVVMTVGAIVDESAFCYYTAGKKIEKITIPVVALMKIE